MLFYCLTAIASSQRSVSYSWNNRHPCFPQWGVYFRNNGHPWHSPLFYSKLGFLCWIVPSSSVRISCSNLEHIANTILNKCHVFMFCFHIRMVGFQSLVECVFEVCFKSNCVCQIMFSRNFGNLRPNFDSMPANIGAATA